MNEDQIDPEQARRAFVERVRASGNVWGLRSEEGWAYCESADWEDTDVLVFWSDRALAEKHAKDDWADHEPAALPVTEFVEHWLPGMDEDGVMIGPDWDENLSGPEVEPSDLAADFAVDEEG